MKSLRLTLAACAALLSVAAAGCGSNKTSIAVTVQDPSQPAATSITVLENSTKFFAAGVTGTSTNTVSWFICLPSTVATTEPTDCTPNLAGYGTITQTGLYTAPPTKPASNNFLIMATSTVDPAVFGAIGVQITSGITVTFSTPTTILMATQETYQLAATVRGTTNTALVWSVNGVANGDSTNGTISPSGLYMAPAIAPGGVVSVTATSVADSSASATARINVTTLTDPTVASVEPATVAAGSAQQVVYVRGANFLDTSSVAVPISGILTRIPTSFVDGATLQATIPAAALQSPGNLPIQVQAQNNNLSSTSANLAVAAVRPALLSMAPRAISQSAGGAGLSLSLAGGFFSPGTTASFNGSATGVTTSLGSSRQMSVGVPAGAFANPGLYPLVIQNTAAATAGIPSMAGLNLTVTPNPGSIPGSAIATVAVGANSSSVAMDRVDGVAVVANKNTGANSDGSVSVISLATNAVVNTYPTNGNNPTSVAVDDLLPAPLAIVVNSTDQTVSGINLSTGAVTTLSIAVGTGANGTPILPYSVGVNPLTHRAIVAYQNSNQATILDTSTGVPVLVGKPGSLGGTLTQYSTGFTPSVAVDSRLNWAVITPGGAGAVDIVDLGRNATPGGLPARNPVVVGVLFVGSSLTVQGVGLDPINHQVLFTDSNPPGARDTNLTAFSLLDQSVQPITFTSGGQAFTEAGFVASAINPLTGVGVAVNQLNNIAAVVDMHTGNVLSPAISVGSSPVAVAVDPASDEAVVANGDGTASVLSLGPAVNPLQIVETSPDMTLTSSGALSLAIIGSGFTGTSQVLLDGAPVTVSSVSANGREILASVPAGGAANLLAAPRRFLVQVQTGAAVSNLSDLSVIQAVPVGKSPVGVAVDTDRDLAVVTNSGDNTVSLVALTSAQTGAVGAIATQPVGANPQGVAIYPLGGLAVVANHDGNSVSIVDDNFISGSQLNGPYDVPLCALSPGSVSGCTGPTGVAVDGLKGTAVVTNSTSNNLSFITLPADSSSTASLGSSPAVDAFPNAVAIDPNPQLNLAAVAAASSFSTSIGPASLVDFVSLGSAVAPPRDPGFELPTGIVFDPLNQMFLVANSLQNQVVIVDPATGVNTPVPVGINPTSLDYNYQTGTLVTANTSSNTVSVIQYMCAPNGSGAFISCPAPSVQAILPLAGSQQFSIAVDPRLNLAVLADQPDNQVLLVPLPY